jgi:hypothetical protein
VQGQSTLSRLQMIATVGVGMQQELSGSTRGPWRVSGGAVVGWQQVGNLMPAEGTEAKLTLRC